MRVLPCCSASDFPLMIHCVQYVTGLYHALIITNALHYYFHAITVFMFLHSPQKSLIALNRRFAVEMALLDAQKTQVAQADRSQFMWCTSAKA